MRQKIRSYSGLRTIALIMVFVCHTRGILSKSIPDWGTRGVDIFLIMSGFLMYYNYGKKNINGNLKASIQFTYKKIKKLYLIHIVTFLFALFYFVYPVIKTGITTTYVLSTIKKAVPNLLLLQSWIPNKDYYFAFNGVTWYLSTILFCYFLTPLLIKLIDKIKSVKLMFIWIGIVVMSESIIYALLYKYLRNDIAGWIATISPFYRVLDYSIGLLAGCIRLSTDNEESEMNNVKNMTIMQIITLSLYFISLIFCLNLLRPIQFTIMVVVVLFAFSYEGKLADIMAWPLFQHIAAISMEFFMIHQIVFRYIDKLWMKELEYIFKYPIVHWLLVLIVSIICAELLHYILKHKEKKR